MTPEFDEMTDDSLDAIEHFANALRGEDNEILDAEWDEVEEYRGACLDSLVPAKFLKGPGPI